MGREDARGRSVGRESCHGGLFLLLRGCMATGRAECKGMEEAWGRRTGGGGGRWAEWDEGRGVGQRQGGCA
jgi:hypothetical protein